MPDERIESSRVIYKTPEQLHSQVKWARIETGLASYPVQIPPDKETISRAELDHELFLDPSDPYASRSVRSIYERYLTSLRKIRREQAQSCSQAPVDAKGYLESVHYPSEVGFHLSEKFQDTYGQTGRLLTDQQTRKATSTQTGLTNLLIQLMATDTEKALNFVDEIVALLPPNKAKEILTSATTSTPGRFLYWAGTILPLLPEQDRKVVVEAAINSPAQPGLKQIAIYSVLSTDQHIAALFTPDETRAILIKALANSEGDVVTNTLATRDYLQAGLLTIADVRTAMQKDIDKDSRNIYNHLNLVELLSEEDKTAFKERFAQIASDPKTYLQRHRLEDTTLFSREEKIEIIQRRVAANPELALQEFADCADYLSTDQILAWLMPFVRDKAPAVFSNNAIVNYLIHSPDFTVAQKQDYVTTLISELPNQALRSFSDVVSQIPLDERFATFRSLVDRADTSSIIQSANEWSQYMPEPEVKEILKLAISKDTGFGFTTYLVSQHQELAGHFTQAELKQLLYQKIELYSIEALHNISPIRKILGSDQELKLFLDRAITSDPYSLLNRLEDLSYLYSPDEIESIIRNNSSQVRGLHACIWSINRWGLLLRPEFVWDLLRTNGKHCVSDLLQYPSKWINLVPETERAPFLESLVRANPPVAIAYAADLLQYSQSSEYPQTLTQDEIIRIALSDQQHILFAPVTLSEFYKDIATTTDRTSRRALLMNANEVYDYINQIEDSGLTPLLERIRSNQKVAKVQEVNLLGVIYCLAKLKDQGIITQEQIDTFDPTYDEVSEGLLTVVSQKMGLAEEVTPDQTRRFFSTMHTAAPFMIYFLQYGNSVGHQEVLKSMFISILDGKFAQWKFGTGDADFKRLQQDRLLPQTLTYEQYLVWTKDEQTTTFESLSADAEEVAMSIRRYILDNLSHLGINIPLTNMSSDELYLQNQQGLADIGQELASVNRELSALRKNNPVPDQIQALASQKSALANRRKHLLREREVIRLASIRIEEVLSGYLLDRADPKKKLAPLARTLNDLKEQFPPEERFVIDTVQAQLDSFHDQTQGKQNLAITDSSNPQVLIEIGERPVSSCQHYAHGSFNECLLGYSDPNTKILLIRNEKGSPVARSVLRLLKTVDGQPALHIEHIYTTIASPAVPRGIYLHVYKKAQDLGVPLYTSVEAQNEEGALSGAVVPEGFSLVKSEVELISEASRAPKVYVDSAGGARSLGDYKIGKLAKLRMG